ncbi:MAG: peptidylprolyl isomerase [Defluviitaleaceae bacterium]|nr:peptidylprolyl isomerase [Defluviitaleaceae bacterium]
MHTNHGDIVIRMFPDEAPEAYENFVTHARDGFYNNVVFHRVIEGFMIQGGDPTGTGAGGGSIWGSGFYSEPSDYLRHFRGALAMAHAGPGTNGSQFYIVQNHTLDGGQLAQFEAYAENPNERYTADMAEGFIRYGGTPFLDLVQNARGHTVFGQVVLGMDVVDHIASLDSGDHNRNIPIEDVIIQNVSVEAYAG